MINPQKGIDLMNNNSIINRILFVVTIFQQGIMNLKSFSFMFSIISEGPYIMGLIFFTTPSKPPFQR
jgi:hypothetical protein